MTPGEGEKQSERHRTTDSNDGLREHLLLRDYWLSQPRTEIPELERGDGMATAWRGGGFLRGRAKAEVGKH